MRNEKKIAQAHRAKEPVELTLAHNGETVIEKRIVEMSDWDKRNFPIGDYFVMVAIEKDKKRFYVMIFEGDEKGNIYSVNDGTTDFIPLISTSSAKENEGFFPREAMGIILDNYADFLSKGVYQMFSPNKKAINR